MSESAKPAAPAAPVKPDFFTDNQINTIKTCLAWGAGLCAIFGGVTLASGIAHSVNKNVLGVDTNARK